MRFFVHIPKSAGSSARAFVQRSSVPLRVTNVLPQDSNDAKAADFFWGHFMFFDVQRFPADSQCFTFLRDPVERVVSYYWFWKTLRFEVLTNPESLHIVSEVKKSSFEDFLVNPLFAPAINNAVVRALTSFSPHQPMTEMHLADAKNNLATRFRFVGLQERMDESMARFADSLGVQRPQTVPTANRRKDRINGDDLHTALEEHDIPSAARDVIKRITTLDQKLYEYACELFEKRA